MLKIYKYDVSNDGYCAIVNGGMKGRAKAIAVDEWIVKNGIEVSIRDYLCDVNRKNTYRDGMRYKCFGKAENCIEKLVYQEFEYIAELSYCDVKERYPEDLVDGRTDWDTIKEYADNLYYFIESLKADIANGVIRVSK